MALRHYLPLALVIALAAAVRIGNLAVLQDLPMFVSPEVDARVYPRQCASVLAGGNWLLNDQPLRMSPGYQYLLGAVYRLTDSGPWPIRVLQLLLGLCSVVLVWDIARRMFGRAWSWVPAFGLAIYGPAIFYESTRLATTTALTAHALLLWFAVRYVVAQERRWWCWLTLGAILGLCAVLRPNALLLALPLAFAATGAWHGWRDGWQWSTLTRIAALALGCVLVLSPITIRNWVTSGHFIALTDHGGQNFYIGNGPGANGTWRIPQGVNAKGIRDSYAGFHKAAEQAAGHTLSAVESDRYWYRQAFDTLLASPRRAFKLMVYKLRLFWNGHELANVYDYHFYRTLSPVLSLPMAQFIWLSGFALLGSVLMLWGTPAERVVGSLNLTACLAVVLFFVLSRYRMPIIPGALIAAVFLLRGAFRWVTQGHWAKLGTATVCVVAMTLLAGTRPVVAHFDREYYKLGKAYHRLHRFDEAENAYRKAMRVSATNRLVRRNLAVLLERRGALETGLPSSGA